MSMFDEMIIKKDLPLPEEIKNFPIDWKNYKFQTKDLESCMLDFWISEEGELFEHVVEREYIPYSEEEKKKNKNHFFMWKDVIDKSSSDVKVDYHGKIRFYTYEDFDDENDFWLEFEAFFVYGKLDKIELKEFRKETSRKITNEETTKFLEKEQNHPWNVFRRYAAHIGWKWFWRKVANLFYKLSSVCSKIQMFVIRYIS